MAQKAKSNVLEQNGGVRRPKLLKTPTRETPDALQVSVVTSGGVMKTKKTSKTRERSHILPYCIPEHLEVIAKRNQKNLKKGETEASPTIQYGSSITLMTARTKNFNVQASNVAAIASTMRSATQALADVESVFDSDRFQGALGNAHFCVRPFVMISPAGEESSACIVDLGQFADLANSIEAWALEGQRSQPVQKQTIGHAVTLPARTVLSESESDGDEDDGEE